MTTNRLTEADRVPLAHLPTPLEPMDRLAEWLGGPRLLVKRDDLTGLALGGNKARKLEYLCAEALAQGCDTLVTGGGHQSNHVRMTAAAANRLGLDCHLAVGGHEPSVLSGNLLLDVVLGATLHYTGAQAYYETESAIEELAAKLAKEGRRPFAMPIGGASVTGAASYVAAADELRSQLAADGDGRVDWVVVANGSGGTHAGLLAGLEPDTRVLGVDVGTRPDLDTVIPRLAAEAAAYAGRETPTTEPIVDHTHFGEGYGRVTDEALEAIRQTARCEGQILDPVYTGKAMAGLIGWVREGKMTADDTVVFWHTGGAVALFAKQYADVFSP
ncbi:MAG: 1-aminocyclopropane-1-carboxylate deaminase/D-cysteine desulfhydrase [Actinomycetota bacterium]